MENSTTKKSTEKSIRHIDLSPDTIKAIKFYLKSAMNMVKATDARLIILDEHKKHHIIGFSNEKLNSMEQFLIEKTEKKKNSLIYSLNENVSDDDSPPVYTKNSYIFCPLIDPNHGDYLGVLFVKDKSFAEKFSSDDKGLLDTLTRYFLRIWSYTTEISGGNDLYLKFSESLQVLSDKIELERENLDARQLIGEIIRVSKLINSTLDIHALLESIMESAKLVIKSEGSSLMLIDEKANELYFNIVTGEKEQELKQIRIPVGTGIAGMVAQSHQPEIVNDAQHDNRVYKTADEKAGFVTRNLIACPLMVRDKIIGVLEVINAIGREEFSKEDLDLFITFSEQAAIAIHNRELIQSLQKTNTELSKKVHELSGLHEVSKVLITKIDEKELFDSVVKIIAEVLEAERASIMIFRSKLNRLELISHTGIPQSELKDTYLRTTSSIAATAFNENRVIHSDYLRHPDLEPYRKKGRYMSDTCIVYPLISENSRYGVISISDKKNGEDFNQDDIQMVSTLSGQIIKAIENFDLLAEMLEKQAYEKELEITSAIQKSILPVKAIESEHFDLGFISRPAKIMGGDFFDFFGFSDTEFCFHIADVSGKSLPAALFMAITSSFIKTLMQDYSSPAEMLKRANDLVFKNSHSGMFVTLFYLLLNTNNRNIKFASAGHNEQFIYRPLSDEFIFMEAKGSPMGVISSSIHGPFHENSIIYQNDDLIVLYTDGIVEAINENQEEFGIDRFKALIKSLSKEKAQTIADSVFNEVNRFAGKEPQFDDFTLMILKMSVQG